MKAHISHWHPSFTQEQRSHQAPHPILLSLGFQKRQSIPLNTHHAFLRVLIHLTRMKFPKMIQPTHAEIQAAHIPVLPSCSDRLPHGGDGFAIATKISLQDGKIQEGVLVEGTIPIVHSEVEVAVQALKRVRVIASAPGVEKSAKGT
jgi:hypothetical protein